jgi:L-fuculose-phosphate aldolase
VVHTHAQWATVLSIARKPIPAVHYMIAAFGGADIPLADYATFGTPELSAHILAAMQARAGCLMANHGMVVGGRDLTHALWLANELEALAHQYYHASVFGGAHIVSAHDIDETLQGFSRYGAQAKGQGK